MLTPLQLFQKQLESQDIELGFVQNPLNIGYLTQFYSEPHERLMLLVFRKNQQPLLVLPALDVEKAKQTVSNIDILSYLDSDPIWEILATTLNANQTKCAVEKDFMTVQTAENIQKTLNCIMTQDLSPLITQQKLIKTPEEIQHMIEAGKTADLAIKYVAQLLDTQQTESQMVAELEYLLKKQGVPAMSFETMILTQQNAANPHGEPENNMPNKNEFVLVDLGTMHNGYASDITRTLFYGDHITDEQEKLYNIVLEAHHAARDAAKIGMTAGELDKIARDIITAYGYGDYFTHRLGHGIGQSVHEFPSIASNNDFILQENMCFSIEPGIYIPNKIGIRIEDCFYLTKDGAKSFTNSPYSLNYKDYQ